MSDEMRERLEAEWLAQASQPDFRNWLVARLCEAERETASLRAELEVRNKVTNAKPIPHIPLPFKEVMADGFKVKPQPKLKGSKNKKRNEKEG